ncbi:class II fructose-bisphosphate aldolase [Patescibacteria group bacterium]|nr:class II fructose-bisphosphate aldolase [Patescibacteria group bacterium]
MIANVKEILTKAREGGYAVGSFNTFNLETTRAIIEGAREMNSPVIVQVTEKTTEYAGGRGIFNLIKNEAEFYSPQIPVGIHVDHGRSFEFIERVIEIGFTSVMYDGSRKEYGANMEVTKDVVNYCHEKGVCVQAELGRVPYLGEISLREINWDEYLTDPEQARDFVEKTGTDSLAVAIGNAHGFFKEKKEIDFERLAKINEKCQIPLVLHGASDWDNGQVTEAIKNGISCFNIDTAIRLAFINNLANAIGERGDMSLDARKLLGAAREAVKNVVKEKIRIFGSEGKA